MVDLWLLASCAFIIGFQGSSYSRVAILLNGSPRCKAIDDPLGMLQYAFHRTREVRRRLSSRLGIKLS